MVRTQRIALAIGHPPTTDGRTLILRRYTEPTTEQKMLIEQLKLTLPSQPPPSITAPATPLSHTAPQRL